MRDPEIAGTDPDGTMPEAMPKAAQPGNIGAIGESNDGGAPDRCGTAMRASNTTL